MGWRGDPFPPLLRLTSCGADGSCAVQPAWDDGEPEYTEQDLDGAKYEEKLKEVAEKYGERARNAVKTATDELRQWNPSGNYSSSKVW